MSDESTSQPPVPRHRPTSRLVVLDGQDRLLMLLIQDPRLTHPRFWITPGGGVEPNESFEQAATRELWEETGIVAPLGPCIWTRRFTFPFDGGLVDMDERYYLVRVDAVEIGRANLTALEQEVLTDHRWWTLDDLRATADVVAPRCLTTVLPPILAGAYPDEPLAIGR